MAPAPPDGDNELLMAREWSSTGLFLALALILHGRLASDTAYRAAAELVALPILVIAGIAFFRALGRLKSKGLVDSAPQAAIALRFQIARILLITAPFAAYAVAHRHDGRWRGAVLMLASVAGFQLLARLVKRQRLTNR